VLPVIRTFRFQLIAGQARRSHQLGNPFVDVTLSGLLKETRQSAVAGDGHMAVGGIESKRCVALFLKR
jgi:hypothetical protein